METTDPVVIHILYLSYAFRALAVLAGVTFVVLGVRLIDRHSRREGQIEGAWKSFKLTMSNAPVGTFLTALGTGVVITSLLVGGSEYESSGPAGRTALRVPASEDSVPVAEEGSLLQEQEDSILSWGATANALSVGDSAYGRLGDREVSGRPFAVYRIRTSSSTDVTVRMESEEVDAFLIVLSEFGEVVADDDDAGGNQNAELSFDAEGGSTYLIVATTYLGGNLEGDFVIITEGN